MTPDMTDLLAVIDATWRPIRSWEQGGWRLREGGGGGSRVSAASLVTPGADIAEAEAEMDALAQPRLFQIGPGQEALDAALADRGYTIKDPVHAYVGATADLLAPIPPVTTFEAWPITSIQRELWDEGGIGPGRLAVMERAPAPRMTLLGRTNDAPAGCAFVGAVGEIAMIHAVHVSPAHRRRGLGAHLTRAAAQWAHRAGIKWLSLVTTRENTGANALYSSLGMGIVGGYHYRIGPDHP